MQKGEAKIHYLFHSGFSLQTSEHFLVFDYYQDEPFSDKVGLDGGVVTKEEISHHKKPIVFSSHSHGDHFNPCIFKWENENPDIRYVFSDDILAKGENIYAMKPLEKLDLEDFSVETFESTDLGVAFLVSVDGLNIFHAGDLNLWHWKDQSTVAEVKASKKDFLEILDTIKGKKIDIAFFPADPRLGTDFAEGADIFIDLLKPSMLVPMHFGENHSQVAEFSIKHKGSATKVAMILRRGQSLMFK